MEPRPALVPSLLLMQNADGSILFVAIDKLRRIVENQQRGIASGAKPLAGTREVPCQDLLLAYPFIRQETIGGFRIRPVLTRERNAATDPFRKLASRVRNLFPCRAS